LIASRIFSRTLVTASICELYIVWFLPNA
jgi:hypothetical protein